jgi:type VII secretion integral membrane protein EccD
MKTTGLVRVTVAAPRRRIDMALPERSPVAEILPALLRHGGESLADDGAADGGWLLRRADGTALDSARSLGAHRVHDGEVLHLVSRRTEWPELEYDDLVDAIATGAGRTGRLWGPRQTRQAGLAAGAAGVLLAVVAVLRAGPPWPGPGYVALGFALVLLAAGTVLSRAMGDAGAGSVLAALALPHAFAGGALLPGGGLALTEFGAPQVLGGSSALLLASVLGHLGVADRAAVFATGATAGLFGALGAWVASTGPVDGAGAAAIVAGVTLVFSPLFTPLAIRLSRVPMPVLPRTAADLVRDDPQPPRHAVYAAVLRADALLTGMISGSALATAACQIVLAHDGGTTAVVLLVLLCLGFCLRARLYPAIRHRVPMLAAGLTGAACLAAGPLMADSAHLIVMAGPVLLAGAGLIVLIGLVYSRKTPNAYLGRYAETLEVLIVLACVPVVCGIVGLFGFVRGLGG